MEQSERKLSNKVAIVFPDTKTIALPVRSLDRWVSLHHSKFQTESTPETHTPYVPWFANTALPNLQST